MSKLNSLRLSGAYVILLSAVGCGDDFTSRTHLEDYRVMGIEASPPEVSPSEVVSLTAHDFDDSDQALSYRWSLCLHSYGIADNFDCRDPELEMDIGDSRTVDLDLGELDIRQRLVDIGPITDGNGVQRTLERGFDVWIRLESGPDCVDCKTITTAKRLRLSESSAPNNNPVIDQFRVVGETSGATTVALKVDVSPPETHLDPDTAEATVEEYLYTWYSTAGETDPALTFGDTAETELLLSADDPTTTVSVAIRDGRGGLAVKTLVIEL